MMQLQAVAAARVVATAPGFCNKLAANWPLQRQQASSASGWTCLVSAILFLHEHLSCAARSAALSQRHSYLRCTSVAWLWFLYSRHAACGTVCHRIVWQVAQFARGVIVLAQPTLHLCLLFLRHFGYAAGQLQRQLFDATLQLQGASGSSVQQRDQATLPAALAKVQQQLTAAEAAAPEAAAAEAIKRRWSRYNVAMTSLV